MGCKLYEQTVTNIELKINTSYIYLVNKMLSLSVCLRARVYVCMYVCVRARVCSWLSGNKLLQRPDVLRS